jgi:hypothetical protein
VLHSRRFIIGLFSLGEESAMKEAAVLLVYRVISVASDG